MFGSCFRTLAVILVSNIHRDNKVVLCCVYIYISFVCFAAHHALDDVFRRLLRPLRSEPLPPLPHHPLFRPRAPLPLPHPHPAPAAAELLPVHGVGGGLLQPGLLLPARRSQPPGAPALREARAGGPLPGPTQLVGLVQQQRLTERIRPALPVYVG